MKYLLFIASMIFWAIVIGKIIEKMNAAKGIKEEWPFYAKKPMTQIEQVLYHRLVEAMPECIVLAQVQLSRVLGVKKGFNNATWNNRINRMSLDYLVCLKDSTVVAAIELDDSSHNKESATKRDQKKDAALASAGIPIIRWQAKNLPNADAIRAALAS